MSRTNTEFRVYLSTSGPLLLTWTNFNPGMDKKLHPLLSVGWNYFSTPNFKRWNRPVKFGNGNIISFRTLLGVSLLIHAGIKVKSVKGVPDVE